MIGGMTGSWMIYGANGYTGELIAQEARRRGLTPLLAGRNRGPIENLARELGLEARVFALDDEKTTTAALQGVGTVLHCAGPFRSTYRPMVEACLARGVHYLDITGEIAVFEAIAARDAAARRAGVTLLPGAGFDVVPSDCLAGHLRRRLPEADHLALAFASSGGVSRGTLRTSLGQADRTGLVRRQGVLEPIRFGSLRREIDFGSGPRPAIAIPWGDLSTAWRSTGIPNLETYMALPRGAQTMLALLALLRPLTRTGVGRSALESWIARRPAGPDADARARGRSRLWGEARGRAGQRVVSRLVGPEGYALTVQTALRLVERVANGEAPVGFQTPATAFGPDLILEIPGVQRLDE